MAIESVTTRNSFIGNGTVSTFYYLFKILKVSDLQVIKETDEGINIPMAHGVDYTVTGVKNKNGGTVTLTAGNLPVGYKLLLRLNPIFAQETNFDNGGKFFPEVHELAFDRQTQYSQVLLEILSRTVKLPATADVAAFDPTLPPIIGPYRLLMVNSAGTGFAAGPTPQELSDAAEAAISTGEDAAAAAASALAAAGSATASAASATLAATRAGESLTHAGEALTSANTAATQATNASNSATAAAASAVTAASYTILFGVGAPAAGLGVNDNAYINQTNGSFYRKEAGVWQLKVTLTGSAGVSTFNTRAGAVVPQAGDYTATMVGLGNVNNTSDANKPVSTAQQTAIDLKADVSALAAGLATKEPTIANGTDGFVWTMVSGVKTWSAPAAASPLTTKGDLYVFGTASERLPVGATDGHVLTVDSTAPQGVAYKAVVGGVSSVFGRTGAVVAQTGDYTKAQVGLGNVDNTADLDKPISNATQLAINDAYIQVSANQVMTNGTAAVLPAGRIKKIRVSGATANAAFTLPAGTYDGEIVFIKGTSDTLPAMFNNSGNNNLNGEIIFSSGIQMEFMWDAVTNTWDLIRGA